MLVVVLITGFIYWPGLDGPFLLDDIANIVSTHVNYFDTEEILYAMSHNESGDLGRFVSVLSLIFSGIVHGPEAWGYKFHNLAIHLITGLLMFWFFIKLLCNLTPQLKEEKIVQIAGLTSAIWLMHPLLVSTVLYSVQRMAQLSALFTLAALIVYLSIREKQIQSMVKYLAIAYLVFPLFMILAVFSKENGALIPFYILAIEFLVFKFRFSSPAEKRNTGIFISIFAILPVLLGTLFVLLNFNSVSDYSMRTFTMGERLLTQIHVIFLYIKMIFLPRLSDMTLFHDYIQVREGFDFFTALLLLLLCGLASLVVILKNKAPVVAFAIAWFLISHLMESTIISLEMMFEHRNYLAAAGPLLLLVYYLFNVPEYPQLKKVVLPVIILFALLTGVRVMEWKNSETIYQVALEEHPDSFRVLTLMANVYYNRGQTEEAYQFLAEASSVNEKQFGTFLHESIYRCGSGDDVSHLFLEAEKRASIYPLSAYSLTVLDNTVAILNNDQCGEINIEMVLPVVMAAKTQEGNLSNKRFLGFLDKIESQLMLLSGDYSRAIGMALSAYDNTGVVKILGNLAENLLQLNLIGDAEHIINIIADINEDSFGTESALVEPLQAKLAETKAEFSNYQEQ